MATRALSYLFFFGKTRDTLVTKGPVTTYDELVAYSILVSAPSRVLLF